MKIYLFGGALRDLACCRQPKDFDYFVTGVGPNEFMRKTGRSYDVVRLANAVILKRRSETDVLEEFVFEPNLTLDQKLRKSDFTVNALARDLETGELISPYLLRAQDDLRKRILHLSILEESDWQNFAVDFLRISYMILKNEDFLISPMLNSLLSRQDGAPRYLPLLQGLFP